MELLAVIVIVVGAGYLGLRRDLKSTPPRKRSGTVWDRAAAAAIDAAAKQSDKQRMVRSTDPVTPKKRSPRPLRPYAVSIVGERSYQDQIAAVGEGEAVVLFHEPDNPYDDRAVAVVCHGDTLGYLPRGSWLGAALLDEGKGYSAHIKRLSRGSEGVTGVTLEVVLDGEPVGTRDFVPA